MREINNLIRKSVTPFGALVAALLFFVIVASVVLSGITHAGNGQEQQNGRRITIYDRGTEKVIVSQAMTIGDALKEAKVTIDSKDLVEPSINEKLTASDYQVNIYRARPVTIIDGNMRIKVITAYQTAEQIAQSAGIKLYDEDKTILGLTDDVVTDGVGLQLTIERATTFNFNLYGKTQTMRTQGTTVGEMLAEKGVNLAANDKVSPDRDTKLTEGLVVRVWREGKQTVTVNEVINFTIDKIEDADQMVSYHAIKTSGEQGSRSVSYEITVQNGREVSRTEIASVVTKQPIKQVEVVGVKGQYNTPIENENIVWGYLISKGFSPVQTAGIMGNLMQEHHFQTNGDGLAQWTGERRAKLYSRPYANNIYTQLDYLMEELNGSSDWIRDKIKSTNQLSEVVRIFQNSFERCGICMENQRISYAQDILGSH